MKGRILNGINNIYTIETDEKKYLCRIKGKVFKLSENFYNPLAAGDVVEFEQDPHSDDQGTIISLEKRRNMVTRWNRKRMLPQIMGSNIDTLVSITSPKHPPFRPRFTDRVFINCNYDVEKMLIVNKNDQKINKAMEERLEVYKETGIQVVYCSAKSGEGVDEIKELLKGKMSVLIGQSGVGKSTLINLFNNSANQKTGHISSKYNRGRHITNFSVLLPDNENGGGIIDTPGIREIFIEKIPVYELSFRFPEFLPYMSNCAFTGCTHVNEPDCAVLDALDKNLIHEDRYQSYINLFYELTELSEDVYGKSYS
jgi:ribosome biogenesis GTPase